MLSEPLRVVNIPLEVGLNIEGMLLVGGRAILTQVLVNGVRVVVDLDTVLREGVTVDAALCRHAIIPDIIVIILIVD